MAGVCWERQGERDECGCELFTVTIGKKKPAHQLILTNTTNLWQIPQRPASGLSFWHVNWKLESLLEEVKSLHFHDSAHGKQKPRQFIGPRKRPWPLAIPFSGTPGHSARGRSASPHGVQGDPLCGTHWNPAPWPHTQVLSLHPLPRCCRNTFRGGRNRSHPLDNVSSLRYRWHWGRHFSSSLFPPFLPSISTSASFLLHPDPNNIYPRDARNVTGNSSMAPPSVHPCIC